MARRPTAVQTDFDSVVTLLEANGTLPKDATQTQMATARSVHALTYSLILWRFRLGPLPNHSRVFVEEIASDALQIFPQLLMGYSKTVKLLARGIVENTLRHLYFSDHPVEFARMNRDGKWYVTIEHLCDYAKQHPLFFQIERHFDVINQMSSIYSELSAGVHGRAVRDLEMRIALSKIKYDQSIADKELALLGRCVVAVNCSLAIFPSPTG